MPDNSRDPIFDDELNGECDAESEAARARDATEREALLAERRARQTGQRGNNGKATVAGALLACLAVLLVMLIGPTELLKMLGILERDDELQKASQVNLEVGKEDEESLQLDFLGPGKDLEPTEDPNAELEKRIAALQKKLEAATRAKQPPDVSLSDVRKLLAGYNEKMARKLEEQREAMEAENRRLRAEAARREEQRRRAEEAARRAAEAERKRTEIDAMQRESAGVVIDESGGKASLSMGSIGGPQGDVSGDRRFLASNAGSTVETVASRPLSDPSRTVVQGTIISAVLETAINTELPGNIRAQVTEPVFSFDGERILMPAGTVLIGAFNENVDVAQSRVLIAWNRAITPGGQSIALGSTGADLLGRAGTAGNVDNRYFAKFGAATLISAITALPAALAGNVGGGSDSRDGTTISVGGRNPASVSVGRDQSPGEQLASDMAGQVADQSQGILEKYFSLPPIIRVPQGEEIRVFVNRDLVFK